MSLYNDLATVFTPYANKIKQNESDISDIQDALEHLDVATDTTLTQSGAPADAKAVGDEFTNLKSALNPMYTLLSESGYIRATGEESANAEYGRTGFIRFNPTDRFFLYNFRNGSASLAYAFYSDDKSSSFISGAGNLYGNLSSDDITIPINTKYVRFSTWIQQRPDAKVVVNNSHGVQDEIAGVQDEIAGVQDEIAGVQDEIAGVQALKSDYSLYGFINISGAFSASERYRATEFIPCDSKTVISLANVWTGDSSLAYAFYAENYESSFISGQNGVQANIIVANIPSNAKYVRLCSRVSSGENPIGIVANYLNALGQIQVVESELDDKLSEIEPKNTTFFAGVNYFDPDKTTFYTDRFCNAEGKITGASSTSNTSSISLPVKPNTHYIIYLPDSNRAIVGESSDGDFRIGAATTPITGGYSYDKIDFTTGANAKYVFIYFYSGIYDYETKKANITLNKNVYTGNAMPFIPNDYLPSDVGNTLYGKQLLIFGDSITDTCNFTINSQDQTTACVWKNPSNSYTPSGGTTIHYSMWPKIFKDSQGFAEIRNYARQGASYKTSQRTSGEERQNLHYQITVALNDKSNPNHVFDIDDFSPDIIIFALGTNDGTPNDTFDSAMNKTVLQSDGYSIDVPATLAALDETKFCESARKAFIRIKQAFPMAQIFCVLPIQRANNEVNFGTLRQYLTEMAKRYGCIIIDGAGESGITREFNVWNTVGEYLKDGLHPNEKGQNLMARMILSSLRSHYIPFGTGFNALT